MITVEEGSVGGFAAHVMQVCVAQPRILPGIFSLIAVLAFFSSFAWRVTWMAISSSGP
jgi:hypothetical protein